MNNVIRIYHDDIAHVSIDKVTENIIKVYLFPNMKIRMREYIICNCLKCIEFSSIGKKEGYLHSIP